jgi:hypothetical protein
MTYNKLNNIVGWLVFAIATLVYVLTLEPTSSFWDCGEFISCSYKLMIPHPPGAPFFLLIGRIFSLMASDVTQVAFWVNMVSAISSSLTSLFLFWSITILAKKTLTNHGIIPTLGQTFTILGAGIVGSLAYTFTDSAWFSAVEAEVYAMSSFFTAFVFWAILKWDEKSEDSGSDKWIILIAYMMGLSIGVHLLNLVAIPALAFVIYFKKYPVSLKGIVITLLISGGILGFILSGVITGLPSIAGGFEVLFVNKLGLPFGSGIIAFITIIVVALGVGIYYSIVNGKRILNTSLICFAFILIGYASYGVIVVRTMFDPPIDMNNPGDVMNFESYIKREQYGDRPLLKGPYFTAGYPIDMKEGAPIYRKGKTKYEAYDHRIEYIYNPKHVTLLPRAYSTQPQHIKEYRRIMDLPKGKPTMGDNLEFLMEYQIGTMYVRYFLWNFMGRESDFQGARTMTPFTSDDDLPHSITTNKARNNYYMLPLLAGIFGMIYHFSKNRKGGFIVALLFFFTGIAIVLYLNQPPIEPRERDYTFAGSYWAFSIWIGMAVLFVADALQKIVKSEVVRGSIATILCLLVPGILGAVNWDDHDRSERYHSVDSAKNLLNSCAPNAILFTGGDNDTYPLWYAQEVEGFRTDVRVCNLSLLNTDWYIAQMQRRAYESAPLPITLPFERYMQGTNDQIPLMDNDKALNLKEFIRLVGSNDPSIKTDTRSGDFITYFPSKKLQLAVDKEKVMQESIVPEKYQPYIIDNLTWNVTTSGYVDKKTLIMLDMVANNNWKRPIYFSTTISPSEFLNLQEYTQLEGMAYRLLPVKLPVPSPQGWVNTDIMYQNMMTKFFWRGLDNPKVYYNDWYYNFTSSEREQFAVLAENLFMEGKKDSAKTVLMHSLKIMPDQGLTYDRPVASYATLLFKLGEDKKAQEIIDIMGPRLEPALKYAAQTGDFRELQNNLIVSQEFSTALRDKGKTEEASKYQTLFEEYLETYRKMREGL